MFMTKIDRLKRKSGLSGWCALNQLGISSSLIGFDSGQHFPARGVAWRSISTVAASVSRDKDGVLFVISVGDESRLAREGEGSRRTK